MAIERFEDIEAQNSQESAVTSRYLNTKRVDRLIGKQGQASFSLGLVKKHQSLFSLWMPPYQVRGRPHRSMTTKLTSRGRLIKSGMTKYIVIPANPGSGVQGTRRNPAQWWFYVLIQLSVISSPFPIQLINQSTI